MNKEVGTKTFVFIDDEQVEVYSVNALSKKLGVGYPYLRRKVLESGFYHETDGKTYLTDDDVRELKKILVIKKYVTSKKKEVGGDKDSKN